MPRVGGLRTRTRIVNQAMRLFHQRGYYAISLDEIIAACRLAKGTFYFHFKSKDDLALAVLEMNTLTVPSVVRVCFAGKSWTDGVDAWLAGLVGTPDNPITLAAPMASLSLQLARGNPAFLYKAMWNIRTFERAFYAVLQSHGWTQPDASRRSSTFSALAEGHILRYVLCGDARCIADLRRDLLPLVHPPGAVLPAYVPAAPVRPSKSLSARAEKKVKKPVDIVDKQSIIDLVQRGYSGDDNRAKHHKIVECLADVFWRQGFYCTSLQDVAEASDIPKGSLHSYFKDKRAMAVAVFDHYALVGAELLDRAFAAVSWRRAVDALMAALKFGGLNQYVFGCPLANMGLEFVNTDDQLASRAADLLRTAERRFAEALVAYGRPPEIAASMAGTAIALCEGHLTRMILYDSLNIAEECREDLVELIEK